MKKLITIISIFLLLGCNSKKESKTEVSVKKETKVKKTTPKEKAVTNGKAIFKQRGYNKINIPPIEVNYSGYDTDSFLFKSDENEKTDTNGDGYVVFGKQTGTRKFKLTIKDLKNGKSYDSGNTITFSKQKDFFLGTGLLNAKTEEMVNISFWVTFK